MSTAQYRLTLIGCVTAWLLLGLHLPVLHQLTHHGRSIAPGVLAVLIFLALIGIGALWTLLRSPWSPRSTSGPHDTER
jgi:hypothetical protein